MRLSYLRGLSTLVVAAVAVMTILCAVSLHRGQSSSARTSTAGVLTARHHDPAVPATPHDHEDDHCDAVGVAGCVRGSPVRTVELMLLGLVALGLAGLPSAIAKPRTRRASSFGRLGIWLLGTSESLSLLCVSRT